MVIDLLFAAGAAKGAKSCYDSTVKIASAKNTAETVTIPTPDNTNVSNENASAKSLIYGNEWYRYLQSKYGSESVEWNINSFEDIGHHPTSLRGYSADEIGRILGEGWTRGVYGRNGSGWKYTQDAHPNNSVFYHGGGGEHGGAYWGVSYNNIKIKVVNSHTYISTPNDDALIIFSEDW